MNTAPTPTASNRPVALSRLPHPNQVRLLYRNLHQHPELAQGFEFTIESSMLTPDGWIKSGDGRPDIYSQTFRAALCPVTSKSAPIDIAIRVLTYFPVNSWEATRIAIKGLEFARVKGSFGI